MRTPFTLMTVAFTPTCSVSVSGFSDNGRLTPRVHLMRFLFVSLASVLPAASFGFHLAMDTLAVRLAVPLTGSAEDFHLQGVRPVPGAQKKAQTPEEIGPSGS